MAEDQHTPAAGRRILAAERRILAAERQSPAGLAPSRSPAGAERQSPTVERRILAVVAVARHTGHCLLGHTVATHRQSLVGCLPERWDHRPLSHR